jgi:hypothetical protein
MYAVRIIRRPISSGEPNGRVAIGLTARNTSWAQYGFQFAHEFCHTLANFSNNPQRFVRYPRHANFWLEESLCETASLFTLRAMSRLWRTAPPYPAWRAYAPWLNAYVEQRLALPEHQLPAGTPFLVWFNKSEPALRLNPAIRDRNTIIAIRLLPLFEAEPRGWAALTFLNRVPHSNQSLARHLAKWRPNAGGASSLPKEARGSLRGEALEPVGLSIRAEVSCEGILEKCHDRFDGLLKLRFAQESADWS